MSIALILFKGEGALYPNEDKKQENDPILTGFLECPLDEISKNKLRLEAAVWKRNNGKDFYSLSLGGIPATLFKEEKKKSAESPDYTGSFGPSHEMRIAGWRRTSGTGRQYISIAISEKQNTQNAKSEQDNRVPEPPQNRQNKPEHPEGAPEGEKGFDWV